MSDNSSASVSNGSDVSSGSYRTQMRWMRRVELLTLFNDLPTDPFARRLADMLEDGLPYDDLLEEVYERMLVPGRGRAAVQINGRWYVPIDRPEPAVEATVAERLEAAQEERAELLERLEDVRARIADLEAQL